MIDITRYLRLKDEGFAWIEKREDAVLLLFKRFDPEQGTELAPEVQIIIPELLKDRITRLDAELTAAKAILAEFDTINA